jgi:putative hydrolase of the HAD superfamily
MAMIQAVLFDLDDTIIDHQHSFRAGLKHVRDTSGALGMLSLDQLCTAYQSLLERFHQYVLSGVYPVEVARYERFKALFSYVGHQATANEIQEVIARYQTVYAQEERLVPGIADVLSILRTTGVQIGLVTNNSGAEQRVKIARHQLEPLLDVIIISEEIGVAKPDPRAFDSALRQLDCPANRAVMVGDSWNNDIIGAVAVGMKAVWLNRYNKNSTEHHMVREIQTYTPLAQTLNTLLNW